MHDKNKKIFMITMLIVAFISAYFYGNPPTNSGKILGIIVFYIIGSINIYGYFFNAWMFSGSRMAIKIETESKREPARILNFIWGVIFLCISAAFLLGIFN
jgi:hypothetical protein